MLNVAGGSMENLLSHQGAVQVLLVAEVGEPLKSLLPFAFHHIPLP